MGIRIHKILGYGLDDIQVDGYNLVDPRINIENFNNIWNLTLDDYKEFVKEDVVESAMINQVKNTWFHPIIHDAEYGIPNVLCVTPPGYGWSRHDDIIDWVEETYIKDPRNENGKDWYEMLPDGIFPFNGLYMNANTNENFMGDQHHLAGMFKRSSFAGLMEDAVAIELGFSSAEEAVEKIVPSIPDSVINVCKFIEIFNNEEDIFSLRPMIYCYWA